MSSRRVRGKNPKATAGRRFSKSLSAISILNRQSKRNAIQRHRTAREAAASAVGGPGPSRSVPDVLSGRHTEPSGARSGPKPPPVVVAPGRTRAAAEAARREAATRAAAQARALSEEELGPWSRRDTLMAVIDHLAWEGMTLAAQALQDEFMSRYGSMHTPERPEVGQQSRLLRILNARADSYLPSQPQGGRGKGKARRLSRGGSERSTGGASDDAGGGGGKTVTFDTNAVANPLMALMAARNGGGGSGGGKKKKKQKNEGGGKGKAKGSGTGAGAGAGAGSSSTNPLMALLARSGQDAGGSDKVNPLVGGGVMGDGGSGGSSSPRGRRGSRGRGRGSKSPRSRLRADSMRALRIREPQASDDIDYEHADMMWRVRGATVPVLVQQLMYTLSLVTLDEEGVLDPHSDAVADLDPEFPRTFFLMLTRFSSPTAFLREVLAYHKQRSEAKDNSSLFQVVCVLKYWLKHTYRHMKRKDRMATLPLLRKALVSAVDTACSTTPPLRHDLEELRRMFDEAAVEIATPQASGVERALAHARQADVDTHKYPGVVNMWDVPVTVIAEQWTLLDFCMFQAIPLPELQDKAWGEPRYEHQADHVRAFIDRFNAASLFVTATVVNGATQDERARLIEMFIELSAELLRLNNFTGVNAVVSGLTLSPTRRLKNSWEAVSKAAFERMQEVRKVMSEERSYRTYRQALSSVPEDEACVPHLGVHLFDLTFMEDGNKDELPDRPGLVNFQKWRLIANAVGDLIDCQGRKYDIPYNPQVCNLINTALKEFYFHFDDDRDAVIERIDDAAAAKEAGHI